MEQLSSESTELAVLIFPFSIELLYTSSPLPPSPAVAMSGGDIPEDEGETSILARFASGG